MIQVNIKNIIIALLTIISLSGCISREVRIGVNQDPDKIAVIKIGNTSSGSLTFNSVNNKSIGRGKKILKVDPGKYLVGVHYYEHWRGRGGDGEVFVEAKAGKTYLVEASHNGGFFNAATKAFFTVKEELINQDESDKGTNY